jgi:hypothetical protein
MTTYFQCELSREGHTTVAWIEERGAKVGASVELKSADGEFWRVKKVYAHDLDEAALRQKQANDRNALPSIIGQSK